MAWGGVFGGSGAVEWSFLGLFHAFSTVARSSSPRCQALGASALRGWTALHRAAQEGHGSVVALLLQHKADLEVKEDDGPGARGGRAGRSARA